MANKQKTRAAKSAPAKVKKGEKSRAGMFLASPEPMDSTFFILVLLLLTIGIVMLFSASYANAYYLLGDSFHYISRQLVFMVAGIGAMYLISRIDYHVYHKLAVPAMFVSIILLVAVFGMKPVNDAHRWIFIGPINFQPSEIAKFALVILFAHIISINYDKMDTVRYGIVPFVIILGILAGLLIAEPHLSGTILVVALGAILMIIGGMKIKYLLMAGGGVAVMLPVLLVALGKVDRAWGRIQHWINPYLDARGDGFQTIQSLYAIGSGGLMGAGIGNSKQKYLFLPEPQNDFIFAIICEELGFVGAALIVTLFALLVWRGFVIALRAKDRFGTLVAVGLTAQVGLQALLNIAVVTNTVPNTGINLPFFSAGGTGLLMLLGQMGVILSISRRSRMEKE